eukprot:SAG22_NODE_1616_length_3986_cov_2.289169_2_plen_134_part_00
MGDTVLVLLLPALAPCMPAGVVAAALSLLLWGALALALLDAGLHSRGPAVGYVLQAPQFGRQNGLDRLLVGGCALHHGLGGALLVVVVLYFFLASVWGAGSVGVRCFCIPCLQGHGQIRARKTMPQVRQRSCF